MRGPRCAQALLSDDQMAQRAPAACRGSVQEAWLLGPAREGRGRQRARTDRRSPSRPAAPGARAGAGGAVGRTLPPGPGAGGGGDPSFRGVDLRGRVGAVAPQTIRIGFTTTTRSRDRSIGPQGTPGILSGNASAHAARVMRPPGPADGRRPACYRRRLSCEADRWAGAVARGRRCQHPASNASPRRRSPERRTGPARRPRGRGSPASIAGRSIV